MMKQRQASIYKYTHLLWSVLLVLVIWNLPQSALADVNPQEINAIIRTRDIALQALNTRDFSKIQPYLHPNFTITTVDNQTFNKVPEFEKYWNQQFSSSIKDIKMQLKGDTLRTFLTPEIDVASGEAIASFSFKDGKAADMALRWTAVLQKLQDKWTIQSLHFSSNLLNNPVLNAAQQLGQILAVAAGVGGFLLGAATMLLLRRRIKPRSKGT
ncbi:nuclear transport factor 2 family protein [Nostoc sp. UCD121]|uniref:YybH family protein n=1 Tax=unclassified Nostoc TaxID=2593658 RepID=UPI00162AA142|nr:MULTISPECIES: nuclear transport factor 2 family protein [unclassified Nostoc]MBC1224876.1 nuclear transport factor 2 family protein [Nostoc sp. UCD120]MBC1277253.1 nuclear transport factor 2 family protein [Nostoc sp. UCD121]MBC1297535.1 nuclear transport factor 2 family protein [Nostoc sp. UCD122]